MKPVMYIFVNKGLKMSTGKVASQVAHASLLAGVNSKKSLLKSWNQGGHYPKLIMQCRDTEHMEQVQHYIQDRGFQTFRIIDEGLTEIEPFSFTAFGVVLVDKDKEHVLKTFSSFELYKETFFEKLQRLF